MLDAESKGLTAKHSTEPKIPHVTNVEKLDTLSQSVELRTSTKLSVRTIETETNGDNFLGTIHSSEVFMVEENRWTRTLTLNQQKVTFKIDTGAYVMVVPESF